MTDLKIKQLAENFRTLKKPINPDIAMHSSDYKYKDLFQGLIIDITADQFKDYFKPVYVGYFNDFYKSLVLSNVIDFKPLDDNEQKIYNIIEKYI